MNEPRTGRTPDDGFPPPSRDTDLRESDGPFPVPAEPGRPALERLRVGTSWLLHPPGRLDGRSQVFTGGLAADPHHDLVVVDLPPDAGPEALAAVPAALPPGRRGLRLLFGRPLPQGTAAAGRFVADRTGRVVVIAEGNPLPAAGGRLFIPAEAGRGWVGYKPGGAETGVTRRFPAPDWETGLPDRPWAVGEGAVAEPTPSGVWIRSAHEDARQRAYRRLLLDTVLDRSEILVVVLGVPGVDAVTPADVRGFWQHVPEQVRQAVRFVRAGPPWSPGRHPGDILAAELGRIVQMYNGLPSGGTSFAASAMERPATEIRVPQPDGGPGRPALFRASDHLPAVSGDPAAVFWVTDHGWPMADLPEIRPGVYRHSPDIVVEVVPSGLWVRPAQEPPNAAQVRAVPAHPAHELISVQGGSPSGPAFLRAATDIAHALPEALRRTVRMVVVAPAEGAGRSGHGEAPGPSATRAYGPEPVESADHRARPREPEPGAPHVPDFFDRYAAAAPPRSPLAAALGPEYESAERFALSLVAERPELRHTGPDGDAVAGLAALRVHLLTRGRHTGGSDHGQPTGPWPPMARALADGLSRLPIHIGATALRVRLGPAGVRRYAQRRLLTEWAPCSASLTGTAGCPGDTDVLIWSRSGRRTALLEPDAADRVVFPPGSRFKVLDVRPGDHSLVLLRELDPGEGGEGAGPEDRTALKGLRQAYQVWAQEENSGVLRLRPEDALSRVPGLTAADGAGEDGGPV